MVIKLNGKRHEIAESWESLKTKHYCRYMDEWDQDKPIQDRDFFKLFCILSDTDFKQFHANADNEVAIWSCVRWLIETPFPDLQVPKTLEINGKLVSIPDDIGLKSIGQNIHLRTEIQNKPVEACISIAAAIFLQPEYDGGKFDIHKAKELKAVLDEMPITQIYPIGFFLLRDVLKTGTHGESVLSQVKSSLTRTLRKMLPSLHTRSNSIPIQI